jgi:hypothetical protein
MTTVEVPDEEEDLPTGLRDSRLARLFQYWLAKKSTRRFPGRDDIDPLEFPYALGNILLVEVLRDPLRFKVRVHGTNMVMRAGYDLTGKVLDDLPNTDYRLYVRGRCEGLVRSGTPIAVRHNRMLDGRSRRYEALWLPLSDDGDNVSMLLCAMIYDWESDHTD